ncbi:hypothetical protein C8R44DRAFT_738959 [Mycena epipterygia]|nr:hypothetical protein C8R44DRAFT_738959 [Mycena epipterygia]
MPLKKGRKKADNLRKTAPDESTTEHTAAKHSRFASPEPYVSEEDSVASDAQSSPHAFNTQVAPESDSDDTEDEPDIDFEQEDDIPHPKTSADLKAVRNWLRYDADLLFRPEDMSGRCCLGGSDTVWEELFCNRSAQEYNLQTWLHLSDQHLAALHTSPEEAITIERQQELRKAEKEQKEREKKEDSRGKLKPTQINDFFFKAGSRAPTIVQEPVSVIEQSDSEHPDPMDVDLDSESVTEEPSMNSGEEEPPHWDGDLNLSLELESSLPQHGATIEDMEEEEDNYISVEPFQFSPEVLAEEGLDALPWDPSLDILPREAETPTPVEHVNTPAVMEQIPESLPLPSHTSSFAFEPTCFPHEQGFTMPHLPQRTKLPSPVPTNSAVDVAIQKLLDILHPRRTTGRGHKKSNLDLVTSARLECMIRFLRLYKSSEYTGWMMHSETIATASGKVRVQKLAWTKNP